MTRTFSYKIIMTIGKIIWFTIMTVLGIVFAYPFIYGVLGSLMNQVEFGKMGSLIIFPKSPTLINYQFIFTLNGAILPLINSIERSAWYTFLVSFMSVLCGYALARYKFRLKNAIITTIVTTQVIPGVLTLIPTFLLMSRIPFVGGNNWMGLGGHGLINNKLVLFLPLGWGSLLWVFLFMQSMKTFPKAFEEAAEIDGCNFFGVLLQIVVPMQGPIIAVIAINNALGYWNDWLMPFLYINRTANSTLTGLLGTLASSLVGDYYNSNFPKVFALATVSILPVFAIFLYFQKFIIQGIASVGIKE
jgi:multiple sugar transport system permease protein